ncbi:MAG: 16S rRNA (adenine(1518)-N(6)/adenine(1519)-N(6))-dimethyltransferase, partial [Ruminococcus sp.]|nr:16S rRNA (adenine(1518)-N(6)/adenine(1519)-N(6))-dimethyltransferase [Ruminococcus sp.]
LINADVMELNLNELIAREFEGMRVVVCANLPYYITSPVIMKLLEDKLPIEAITVMVQKEAAERICAEVGTRAGGAVTAAVNFYSEPELLFRVSAGSFMPAPKVDSAVIRLNVFSKPKYVLTDDKKFFKIVKAAFAQRRKTVANSISSTLGIDKAEVISLLEECGVSPTARAENLSMNDFTALAERIL